jgi:hypothetical protein
MNDTTQLRSAQDAMTSIGARYLGLLRERYIDDDSSAGDIRRDFGLLVRQICESGNEQIFSDLLLSSNWREVLVGVYCAITLQAALFHTEDLPPATWAGSPHSSFEQVGGTHQVASQLTEQLARLLVPRPGEPLRPLVTRPICMALALGRNTAALDMLLAHRPVHTDAPDEYAAALTGIQLLKGFSDEQIERTYAEVLNNLRQQPLFDQSQFQESKNRCARALSFWAAGLAQGSS